MLIQATLLIGLLFTLFLLNFYRDPPRPTARTPCVSPADGKIMSILPLQRYEHTIRKGLTGKVKTQTNRLNKKSKVISIFMSPLDVHINRMPVTGTILSVTHHPGPFGMAFGKQSWQNERTEINIKTKHGRIRMFQIAGFLARRIQTWAKPGQRITKGTKIGRIVLGSQVTIILPPQLTPLVKEGQHIKAGTALAK